MSQKFLEIISSRFPFDGWCHLSTSAGLKVDGLYLAASDDGATGPEGTSIWIGSNGKRQEAPTIDLTFPRNEVMIENALKLWAREGWKPGKGNDEFFLLAQRLVRAGVDDHEMRNLLWIAAGTANSPDDRRADIDGVIERARKISLTWSG